MTATLVYIYTFAHIGLHVQMYAVCVHKICTHTYMLKTGFNNHVKIKYCAAHNSIQHYITQPTLHSIWVCECICLSVLCHCKIRPISLQK